MFTKQNTKQKVYKAKLKFTNTFCLQNKTQNKSLQARYVYKTKQMFTTQIFIKQNKTKQNNMFTDKSYLQNKQMFKKQKFYKHVMFTKLGLDTEKCWG